MTNTTQTAQAQAQSASYARNGVFIGGTAFLMWGVLPLYLKLLSHISPMEVLAHRVAWSVICLFAIIAIMKRWTALKTALTNMRTLCVLMATASIIALNWGTYIYAINSAQAIEASMGYFINPLVSVMFGFFFLKESMTKRQWVAVACAAIGVGYMVINLGHFPAIALTLAVSFALYGLLRKKITVDGPTGLLVESLLLVPFALGYLIWAEVQGQAAFFQGSSYQDFLLILAGPVTAVPLTLFGIAVQRVRLSTIGLMQYMAPTVQFLIAVLIFMEPFTVSHMWTFACIWTGLVIYSTPQSVLDRVGLRMR